MAREEIINNLTIKARLVDGIPMVSLEDCCREIQQIDEPKWHTEEPKENGLYAVKYYPYNDKTREPAYCVFKLEDGIWIDFLEGTFHNNKTYAYAWRKIEGYREKSEIPN